jgi:WD40 repeat protein
MPSTDPARESAAKSIGATEAQNETGIARCCLMAQSSDIQGNENFPMGCRWAPDGTCILTATASDGKFRLYDTPFHLLSSAKNENVTLSGQIDGSDDKSPTLHDTTLNEEKDEREASCHSLNDNFHACTNSVHGWNASLTSHQGGPPPPSGSSSYTFYPLFNSSSPQSALYATCRGHSLPIHLIDAYTSALRASYRPHNNVDELEGPTVVEFSPDGSRIYGTGFKSDRTIAVFDTSIPGREGQILRLGKTRRSADGQKGIPSAIAFPKSSAENGPSNVFAVGAYSPASIYIYDDRAGSCPAGTVVLHGGLTVVGHGKAFSRKKRRFAATADTDNDAEQEENWFSSARVNWFQSQARGGVTQLMWAPPASSNPYVLYSASRRSNAVLSWDVRMLSCDKRNTFPVCGLKSFSRDGDTNQRIGFDINEDGRKLFTGSRDGFLKVYDTNSSSLEYEVDIEDDQSINGVSFMNFGSQQLLAVSVGSRHFADHSEEDLVESMPMLHRRLELYSI